MPPTNIPRACPRESGGAGLVGTPSALDFSLHPNLGVLAQCGGELFLEDDAAAHPSRRLPLGVDLQAAINAYLAEHNANPKPFLWTKSAEAILAKLDRCPVPSV
jgi:hypothetical protein